MQNLELMYRASEMCIAILVNIEDFPDFTFVLHNDRYFTHHVVLERENKQTRKDSLSGARIENRALSQSPRDFDNYYVDAIFGYMQHRKNHERIDYNVDSIAVIPFGERRKEVLQLGKVVSSEELPIGVNLDIINYNYHSNIKKIKVYSPPNATLIEKIN